ncbi:hypothetical protein SKAU_G00405650 [Synaphobranchus kaupii]|uniref:Uncharacterized protein n=1 Tax=Synaphobranchus kaupii TaxID=118154 RepID=A0A9Q1EA06_SYNKA|nr:hypothetical protein SKAU_G00405650 [Synaphobranchus kaupii]
MEKGACLGLAGSSTRTCPVWQATIRQCAQQQAGMRLVEAHAGVSALPVRQVWARTRARGQREAAEIDRSPRLTQIALRNCELARLPASPPGECGVWSGMVGWLREEPRRCLVGRAGDDAPLFLPSLRLRGRATPRGVSQSAVALAAFDVTALYRVPAPGAGDGRETPYDGRDRLNENQLCCRTKNTIISNIKY